MCQPVFVAFKVFMSVICVCGFYYNNYIVITIIIIMMMMIIIILCK